ncbi:MAG: hypothetical protein ACRCY5_02835 [Phocaeicola sp.]
MALWAVSLLLFGVVLPIAVIEAIESDKAVKMVKLQEHDESATKELLK